MSEDIGAKKKSSEDSEADKKTRKDNGADRKTGEDGAAQKNGGEGTHSHEQPHTYSHGFLSEILASLGGLGLVLGFFTRLPLPQWLTGSAWQATTRPSLGKAALSFPLAGLVIGLISAMAWLLGSQLLPPLVAAGLALAASVLASGALHEDGLADIADGLGGASGRERALEIMRDSRIGVFGALALVFSVGLRWLLLASLMPMAGATALLIAHSSARGTIVLAIRTASYARDEGLGKSVAEEISLPLFLATLGLSFILAALFGQFAGLLASLLAFAAAFAFLQYLKHRLGGYTGDGLGAMEQIAEIVAMLTLVSLWG